MIIIHGDNQVASRTFLLSIKKNEISLDGESLTLGELQQHLSSVNLFGESSGVLIEGFFSRRPSNEKKKIIDQLINWSNEQIIIWDGKDITTQISKFKMQNIKKFDLPKTVFKYLDTLSLSDLQQTLENTPAELVFSLLAGHIRKLILVRDNVGNLPVWQMAKLKNQSAKMDLLTMHQDLLEIDYKNKTSASSLDLAAALEVWTLKTNN